MGGGGLIGWYIYIYTYIHVNHYFLGDQIVIDSGTCLLVQVCTQIGPNEAFEDRWHARHNLHTRDLKKPRPAATCCLLYWCFHASDGTSLGSTRSVYHVRIDSNVLASMARLLSCVSVVCCLCLLSPKSDAPQFPWIKPDFSLKMASA